MNYGIKKLTSKSWLILGALLITLGWISHHDRPNLEWSNAPSVPYYEIPRKSNTRPIQYKETEANQNIYDKYNEEYEDYLNDPEDEITYPPEIFDFLSD